MTRDSTPQVASADINEKAATDLVTRLIAIPGKSGEEGAVVEFITAHLRDLGIPASAIQTDSPQESSWRTDRQPDRQTAWHRPRTATTDDGAYRYRPTVRRLQASS